MKLKNKIDIIKEIRKYLNAEQANIINPEKLIAFENACKFLTKIGKVTHYELKPQLKCGWMIVECNDLDFSSELKTELISVLSNVNVFNIEGIDCNKIRIGITVNDTFKRLN